MKTGTNRNISDILRPWRYRDETDVHMRAPGDEQMPRKEGPLRRPVPWIFMDKDGSW